MLTTLITLACLWILRIPILFCLVLMWDLITWPFKFIGELFNVVSEDWTFCFLIVACLVGIGGYLMA